jgi:hypothetical protein
MIGTYVISLLLIGLSGVLLDMHRRSWRSAEQDASLEPSNRRFARSQYRRRSQASGIIGLLGAAIGLGPLVPHEPLPITLYLVAISASCMGIMVLAAIDAWATRQYFARLRGEHLAAQVKLVRELRRDTNRD